MLLSFFQKLFISSKPFPYSLKTQKNCQRCSWEMSPPPSPSFPVHLNSQKFPFTSLSPTDTGTSWFSAAKLPKVFLENVPSPSPAFPPLTRVPPLSSGTARSLLPRPPRHCGGKTRKRGSHKLPEHVEKYSPLAWEIWVTWIRHGDCRRKDKMMEGNHEH